MLTSILVHFIDETVHEEAIKFVDPCIALASIGIIVVSSLPLGKRLAMILLLGTPDRLADVKKLSGDIVLRFHGDVLALHEFHIWSLMHSQVVATLHVTYRDYDVRDQHLPEKERSFHLVQIQTSICFGNLNLLKICTKGSISRENSMEAA